jgi:orotidine-5'-phosphate decarboxylase
LDPLESKIPACIPGKDNCGRMKTWLTDIVDATAPYTSMYKPQWAFYESLPYGREVLQHVVNHIHSVHPEIPAFLDCKVNDILDTEKRYAESHFGLDKVDGINFNPYMGKETMSALAEFDVNFEKALVGVCFTSNISARVTQRVKLLDGRMYYEFIAQCVDTWAQELHSPSAGLVMASAFDEGGIVSFDHLVNGRKIVEDRLWFLIPGIGKQLGIVFETVKYGYAGPGTMAINSSSGINFASSGEDYARAAAKKTQELRDQINDAMDQCGYSFVSNSPGVL